MRTHPAGAGYDDDPRRGWDRRRGDVPDGAVVVSSFCPRLNSRFGSLRRSENVLHGLKLSLCPSSGGCPTSCKFARHHANQPDIYCCCVTSDWGVVTYDPAGLTSEAAETLWSASGGGPAASGEAAATSERSERKRRAVRWAVSAEVCGAVGCGRSDGLLSVATGDGRRVLCPEHARRWVQ